MGEAKRKKRELLITKALLLGYTFDIGPNGMGWVIRKPDGNLYVQVATPYVYCARWYAAYHALIHAGVINAPVARGDTGTGSGKSFRLRGGRRQRRRTEGQLKSAGAGRARHQSGSVESPRRKGKARTHTYWIDEAGDIK